MPRNLLSDTACRNARDNRSDGDHLKLFVRPDGRKFWKVVKVKVLRGEGEDAHWRETNFGLGEYPRVGLTQARNMRNDLLEQASAKIDPVAAKRKQKAEGKASSPKAQKARTFESYAKKCHASISGEFRNPKHAKQWLSSLRPVIKKLGARDLADIKQKDLLAVLRPLVKTPETARRVKQRLMSIFASARFDELIPTNPADALNSKAANRSLGLTKADKQHLRALPHRQVGALLTALRAHRASEQSQSATFALEFAILAAARTGEVLGAQWGEFDAKLTTWIVPAARMKAGEKGGDHFVPISEPARAVLRIMKAATGGVGYVFPSPADPQRPVSNMAMLMLLRRLPTGATDKDGTPEMYSEKTTVHGVARATFSTWANQETKFKSDVIECALAHREADIVKAAYDRSREDRDAFAAERRALLEAWARYVSGTSTGKVVALASARRKH